MQHINQNLSDLGIPDFAIVRIRPNVDAIRRELGLSTDPILSSWAKQKICVPVLFNWEPFTHLMKIKNTTDEVEAYISEGSDFDRETWTRVGRETIWVTPVFGRAGDVRITNRDIELVAEDMFNNCCRKRMADLFRSPAPRAIRYKNIYEVPCDSCGLVLKDALLDLKEKSADELYDLVGSKQEESGSSPQPA